MWVDDGAPSMSTIDVATSRPKWLNGDACGTETSQQRLLGEVEKSSYILTTSVSRSLLGRGEDARSRHLKKEVETKDCDTSMDNCGLR